MRRLFIFLAFCIAQMTVSPLGLWALARQKPTGETAFHTLGIRDGLRSNSVTSLLTDSHGYLWIGTSLGLNRYDGHEVKTCFPESHDLQLYEVFNNPVTSIEEDAEGRLWIECESGSYYLYDTKTARFCGSAKELLSSIGIPREGRYKVKVGNKGALWVLSEDCICRYDCHTKELKTWKTQLSLPGKSANVVAEMSDGLYISASHAVWHFVSSTGELQRQPLPDAMQHSMGEHSLMADADGTLWVYSTREEHICRYIVGGRCVKEMVQLPQTMEASQNNAIRHIMDDQRGNVWIATDQKGMFAYNKKTGNITTMRHQRDNLLSLASDNATCLAVDRDGTIWVGHMKTGISYTSDANNTMQTHALQCGDILAMAYDTEGNLWMGTDGDGVYIEKPDGAIVKTSLPNITVMALLSDEAGGMWAGTYNQGLYYLPDASHWKRYAV
ncbi:MAG: hypothetical protein IKM76_12385, partial [Prevotella sp.]|nr:hypothetical protein [Prevotella sp.]